jgi:hypothetical protein
MSQSFTTAGENGLIPAPPAERPLTEAQEAFRRLVAQVEALREATDAEEERLDAELSFYAAEIVPRIARQSALQKDFVRALAPFLNKTFFPRVPERLEIKELLQEFLAEITTAEKGLADADIREIYGAVHNVDYADFERKTLADVKASLAKMFAEAGLDADFSELESAASEAEFMAKAEELIARVRKIKEEADLEAARCGHAGHHSTEDEQLRAAEEFRKRSIANIYKQLARVLHPDLERDVERQKQKVQLMQELTVAFHQNDLHTLLRLQMEWIENEGGDIERLTDEKLIVYNEVLSGQVDGLKKRLRDLVFHPRYRPIFVWNNRVAETIHGPHKARELDDRIAAIEHAVPLINAANSADDVRAAIAPFRHSQMDIEN